jgi:Rieske 2Fe-2S family protein
MNRDTGRIGHLVARRQEGRSLERDFYVLDEVYEAELDRIWMGSWLFAGHSCEVPEPGDYFTYDVAGSSVILIRGDDGAVHGHHNVCRHRGTTLLSEASGRAGRIVCPYHQWVYGRDGRLLSCRGMPEDLDRSSLGLRRVAVEEIEGLLFISLADAPPAFDEARAQLAPYLKPQGFRKARVAKIVDYDVQANWKLVWENNRECYHCNVNHPQYIKANFDHFNADDTTSRVRDAIVTATARGEALWDSAGLAPTHRETGMTLFPEKHWFSANRTVLVDGYVSETMDGRQVAPLMGDYTRPDVGTLRIRALPNFWNHSSCDHGVSTRLTPAGKDRTHIRVTWVVDAKAVEGKDYRLDDLLPFWKLTSEQDWALCEAVQRGVRSRGFQPGPFSPQKEYNVEGWVRWYLRQLSSAGSGEAGA